MILKKLNDSSFRTGLEDWITGSKIFNRSDPALYSHESCYKMGYHKVQPLPLERKRLPVLLYCPPASGANWFRKLVEFATGTITGSVYAGLRLEDSTFSESQLCDWTTSMVKAHPTTHKWINLSSSQVTSYNNNCFKGSVLNFERVIILISDPYETIWTQHQRRTTSKAHEGIRRELFDRPLWEARAIALSKTLLSLGKEFDIVKKSLPRSNWIVILREDLLNETRRYGSLSKITSFLELPSSESRKNCAFTLANFKQVYGLRYIIVLFQLQRLFFQSILNSGEAH